MIGSRFVYTLFLFLILPKILAHLIFRAWRQPEYLRHIPERFGFYRVRAQNVIWIHSVSVGETRAAQPLISQLHKRYPEYSILLTHMTPTGRKTGEKLFPNSVLQCYLPYDFPFAVKRFLSHFCPKVGVLMETEIWFNLIHQCKVRGLPVYLINARLSQESATKYSTAGPLIACALGDLSAIGAQHEDDANRLRELGASEITVTGNLKFDINPPETVQHDGKALREKLGRERRVLLFASSREGEESLLLKHAGLLSEQNSLLVIVPRHPQRFDEVCDLVGKFGFRYQRKSGNATIEPGTQVVIGDTMDEMFSYYAASDIALIGGSFLPFGAQNLIEACAAGTPVIIGPSVYNFSEVTRLAVEAGAATQVRNISEALCVVVNLFENEKSRTKMSAAGLAFCKHHRGATEKTMALLVPGLRLTR